MATVYVPDQGATCYVLGNATTNPHDCAIQGGTYLGDGTTCDECTPPPPTVVATSVTTTSVSTSGDGKFYRIWRTWSDGQLDMTFVSFFTATQCDPGGAAQCGPIIMITGTCPTDVNRDGDTGIQDFLTLLGGWGACR